MVSKYIISEVLDSDTKERSILFWYRVGKECEIDDNSIRVGHTLVVMHPDGAFFITTPILKINKVDEGIWVFTDNRIYKFIKVGDYIDE